MNSQKNFFIIVVFFAFLVSIFGSFLYNKISTSEKISDENDSVNYETGSVEVPSSVVSDAKNIETSVKAIAKKVNPSVVSIIISKDVQVYRTDPFGFFYEPSGIVRKKVGGGSGFFISKDGYIMTNKHVVSDPNATYTIINSDNKEYTGRVVAIDPTNDIAVVRAYDDTDKPLSNTPAVSFVPQSNNIEVGTFVIAIGNALAEFQNTVTFWVVSGLSRSIEASDQLGSQEQLTGLIQTDTAINPGNSGGPLVNLDGKVVGMNTAIAQGANGLGFAIPLSEKEIQYIKTSIEKHKNIQRSFIGVAYMPLSEAIIKNLKLPVSHWYLIAWENNGGIVKGSPAEKAGIESGDVLIEAEGKELKAPNTLKEIIREKFPWEQITFKIWKKKNGQVETVTVTLWQL